MLLKRIIRKIFMYLPASFAEKKIDRAFSKRTYPIVIMFHSIVPDASVPYSVSPEKFEEFIDYFIDHGYSFLFEDEYDVTNQKSVIISIDDGYTNNYNYAYPILKKKQVKATINIIANRINNEENNKYLSIERIKEMKNSGLVQFQSHTYSHPILTECKGDDAQFEIIESQKIIKEKLGIDTTAFVYPCGRMTSDVAECVSSHYRFAFGGSDKKAPFNYRIPREELSMADDNISLSRRIFYSITCKTK